MKNLARFLVIGCVGLGFAKAGMSYQVPIFTPSAQSFSIVALTWNMGNTHASENIVNRFAQEIKKFSYPDIVIIGTQEELAKQGGRLKDQLLYTLKAYGMDYVEQDENYQYEMSYKTLAGANNSLKTAAYVGLQKTPLSGGLNLAQNRTSLCILVKQGLHIQDFVGKIYYPPGSKSSNNAFVVIKGNLIKNDANASIQLPFTFANVHLNSSSDQIRRAHANVFFEGEGLSQLPKTYAQIAEEANHFNLIMGDFNERNYLMKDNSVVDRGYLTNFVAYGYDFFEPQEKNKMTYGTYGFNKLNNNLPEVMPDPRGRLHNAKSGFLDRITFSSGLKVESAPNQYGAIIDFNEFNIGSKIFYSGSDHLPVIRHFRVHLNHPVSLDSQSTLEIVRTYITRRFPNFEYELKKLQDLKDGLLTDNSFIFYDSMLLPERRVSEGVNEKLNELLLFQNQLNQLIQLIKNSTNVYLLEQVYNKITECNIHKNSYLEHMDDPAIEWFIPALLSQETLNKYKQAAQELLQLAGSYMPPIPARAAPLRPTTPTPMRIAPSRPTTPTPIYVPGS